MEIYNLTEAINSLRIKKEKVYINRYMTINAKFPIYKTFRYSLLNESKEEILTHSITDKVPDDEILTYWNTKADIEFMTLILKWLVNYEDEQISK